LTACDGATTRGKRSLHFENTGANSQSFKSEGKNAIGVASRGKNTNLPNYFVVTYVHARCKFLY